MQQENPTYYISDLLLNDYASPLNLRYDFLLQSEEHKDLPKQNQTKKGRPKGLKNDPNKTKKRKNKQKNYWQKNGHWQTQQNKKYHWFLQIYNKHFINKHMRRMDKIFKTMAMFVGTREAQQCRSHHQKMQKKYLTFFKILQHLRKLHYSSCSTQYLVKDLQQSGIDIFDELIDGDLIERNLNSSQKQINEELNRQYQIQDKNVIQNENQENQQNELNLMMNIEESFKPQLLLDVEYSKHLMANIF